MSTATKEKTIHAPVKVKRKRTKAPSDALRDLFEDELKDIYWAEKTLTHFIPKLIKQASSKDLLQALDNHLNETEEQASRLEQVFELSGMKTLASKCQAIDGLIRETELSLKETEPGMIKDAEIITCVQKAEHYQLGTYTTLIAFARMLGEDEAVVLLEATRSEENGTMQKMADLTEQTIQLF